MALVSEADRLAGTGIDVTSAPELKLTLSGPKLPSTLRVGLTQADDQDNPFSSTSVALRENALPLADLEQGDWVLPTTTKDFSMVTDIVFSVASISADYAYDFCVSDIALE